MLSFLAAIFTYFCSADCRIINGCHQKNCSTSFSEKKCCTQVFTLVSGILQIRALSFCGLGLVQTSNFTSAERNYSVRHM